MLILGGIAFVGLSLIVGGLLYFAGYGKKKEKDEEAGNEPANAGGRRGNNNNTPYRSFHEVTVSPGGLAGLRRRRAHAGNEGGDGGNDSQEEAPLTKKQLAKEAKKRGMH